MFEFVWLFPITCNSLRDWAEVNAVKYKKVDIKVLLQKIRTDEKKEQIESNVFFGLIAAAVVVTGVIASL